MHSSCLEFILCVWGVDDELSLREPIIRILELETDICNS